jgi:hypothetical protein
MTFELVSDSDWTLSDRVAGARRESLMRGSFEEIGWLDQRIAPQKGDKPYRSQQIHDHGYT